jgi:hypothetical protein
VGVSVGVSVGVGMGEAVANVGEAVSVGVFVGVGFAVGDGFGWEQPAKAMTTRSAASEMASLRGIWDMASPVWVRRVWVSRHPGPAFIRLLDHPTSAPIGAVSASSDSDRR